MQLYSLVGTSVEDTLKGVLGSRTKKTAVGVLVIVVALSVVAYAYWASLPSTTGPKVTITSSPFELSMALDKTTFSLDDNLAITFYLKNLSNETITAGIPYSASVSPDSPTFKVFTVGEGVTLPFNQSNPFYTVGNDPLGGALPFSFTLTNSSGGFVDKVPGAHTQDVWGIVFGPYASLNQTVTVNLAHYIDSVGHPLQREAYTVIGAFAGALSARGNFRWQTPSIAFTLG